MIPYANEGNPLELRSTDTKPGFELTETWGTSTFTVSSATLVLQDVVNYGAHIAPFTGQSVAFTQTTSTTTWTYDWPSPLPVGTYAAYVSYADAGGHTGSTQPIEVRVQPA